MFLTTQGNIDYRLSYVWNIQVLSYFFVLMYLIYNKQLYTRTKRTHMLL